jgi:hypothetical protein
MKRRPVRAYIAPAYPTAEELGPTPELLRTALPVGWRRVEASLPGIVALFLAASASSCRPADSAATPERTGIHQGAPAPGDHGTPVVAVAEPTAAPETLPVAPAGPVAPGSPETMVVAPLFEHGEGRGATGCVVVAPPVFLSEQEALTIVREELARHGIALGQSSLELDEVRIAEQQTSYEYNPTGEHRVQTTEVSGTRRPLELDAVAPKQHVAVEIVSHESYFAQGGAHSGTTVQGYDLKEVAAALSKTLQQKGKQPLYVGVFYDPVQTIDFRKLDRSGSNEERMSQYRAEQAKQRDASAEQLRAQVRDFASWLRGKVAL